MEPAQLWAFVVFSLVGSFTPGPNTTVATATGANFGFRAALPHIFGVPFGFSTMLALGTLGVAGLLLSLPVAAGAIKWVGIGYLLYLGWLLTRPAHGGGRAAPGDPALHVPAIRLVPVREPEGVDADGGHRGDLHERQRGRGARGPDLRHLRGHLHDQPGGVGLGGRGVAGVAARGPPAAVVQWRDGAVPGGDRPVDGDDNVNINVGTPTSREVRAP